MFKARRFKMIGLLLTTLLVTPLASCTSFFGKNEIMIDDIVTTINGAGDIVVTITFVNDAKDPLTFTIPQGKPGVGIANITQTPSPDGLTTMIVITYTDQSIKPLTFTIQNGTTISNITSEVDPKDETQTLITVTLNNGEILTFQIDRPKDGIDGNGITGITQTTDENGTLVLTFHFSASEDVRIEFPFKQGEQGNGIEAITMQLVDDQYCFTFFTSDGASYEVFTDRPATWTSGIGAPTSDLGITGDFYYDTYTNVIYLKNKNGKWDVVVDFNDAVDKVYYTVNFDLNTTALPYASWESTAVFPDGTYPIYEIAKGHTFYDTYDGTPYAIPVPTRDGFVFDGWYTQKIPTINSSRFGDLVPVHKDMTLYAKWLG